MRRIHSSRTALRLCAGAGDLAKTPSGRKQAWHPRASGDEAGLSRERPGCPAGASRTPVRGWRGCSFVTECNSQGRVLLPQVATCQVFKIMPGHWAQTANRSPAPGGPLPCGALRPLPGEPAVLSVSCGHCLDAEMAAHVCEAPRHVCGRVWARCRAAVHCAPHTPVHDPCTDDRHMGGLQSGAISATATQHCCACGDLLGHQPRGPASGRSSPQRRAVPVLVPGAACRPLQVAVP